MRATLELFWSADEAGGMFARKLGTAPIHRIRSQRLWPLTHCQVTSLSGDYQYIFAPLSASPPSHSLTFTRRSIFS